MTNQNPNQEPMTIQEAVKYLDQYNKGFSVMFFDKDSYYSKFDVDNLLKAQDLISRYAQKQEDVEIVKRIIEDVDEDNMASLWDISFAIQEKINEPKILKSQP